MDASLAGVESAAVVQGLTFLYGQAGEMLRRHREAKDRAAASGPAAVGGAEPLPPLDPPAGLFLPDAAAGDVPLSAVESIAPELLQGRRGVEGYVLGEDTVDPSSPQLIEALDRLRILIEGIYATKLTFVHEQRAPAAVRPVVRTGNQSGGVFVGGSMIVGGSGQVAGGNIGLPS